jgi:hypothetical protein
VNNSSRNVAVIPPHRPDANSSNRNVAVIPPHRPDANSRGGPEYFRFSRLDMCIVFAWALLMLLLLALSFYALSCHIFDV